MKFDHFLSTLRVTMKRQADLVQSIFGHAVVNSKLAVLRSTQDKHDTQIKKGPGNRVEPSRKRNESV